MPTYSMTIDGQSRAVTVPDEMIDGLNAAMTRANEAIPATIKDPTDPEIDIPNPDRHESISTYFEKVLQGHGADLDTTVARALASYNGADAPPTATPAPLTGEALKASLRAYAAEKRWTIESGGCIDPNGNAIATDRDSQTKLIAEMIAMGANLRTDPSPWKLRGNGFVMLTNAQMMQAIMAARNHIASAFVSEATALAGITDGTITTPAQIDTTSWPSNS